MVGKLIEETIIAKLESKCDIKRSGIYDHDYKLDFIIDRFKNIDKLIPVGIQITTRINDIVKQRNFLALREKKTLVDKSIYVEVHPDVDISKWGVELIYNAIVSFIYQKKKREEDIIGVRINPDVTFDYFDLADSLRTGIEMRGKVVQYFSDQNYGFIESEDNNQWLFDCESIIDSALRLKFIPNIQYVEGTYLKKPIYVDFEDGGKRNGDATQIAIGVRLSRKAKAKS